jgi:hypothetical protein
MPEILALSFTVMNWIAIWPLEFAVAENWSAIALSAPPAAAMMSKFDRTVVPLILTLKMRCPLLVQ